MKWFKKKPNLEEGRVIAIGAVGFFTAGISLIVIKIFAFLKLIVGLFLFFLSPLFPGEPLCKRAVEVVSEGWKILTDGI
jgi:hypothetical protein